MRFISCSVLHLWAALVSFYVLDVFHCSNCIFAFLPCVLSPCLRLRLCVVSLFDCSCVAVIQLTGCGLCCCMLVLVSCSLHSNFLPTAVSTLSALPVVGGVFRSALVRKVCDVFVAVESSVASGWVKMCVQTCCVWVLDGMLCWYASV